MKKLLIVDAYPSNQKRIRTLESCIKSIKPLGWDILVVSHAPVPTDIQSLVDYCIYDKNNLMVPSNISPHIFSSNETFDFKVYIGGHALAVSISFFNSFSFANSYDYDFCYYISSDCIFSETDLKKLEMLVVDMEKNNKDMIIFNPKDYIVKDCYYGEDGPFFYETLMFGAKPKQFIEIFNPPRTVDEWLKNDMCYNLESCLYHKYKDYEDKCYIIPNYVHQYFNESIINEHRFGMFVCDVIFNKSNPISPIFLINHLHGSNTKKIVKLYINDVFDSEIQSYEGTWYYRPFFINGDVLKIEVYENDELDFSSTYIFDENILTLINNKLSYIYFH